MTALRSRPSSFSAILTENGVVDGGDAQLGSSTTFSGDNGTATFTGAPLLTVSAATTSNVLLRYDFGAGASGTFQASIASAANVSATGVTSGAALTSLGTFPINGNTLTTVAGAPEMDVTGLGVSIADGDTTPTTSDGTDFGNVSVGGEMAADIPS
jgi:hypothetical protein